MEGRAHAARMAPLTPLPAVAAAARRLSHARDDIDAVEGIAVAAWTRDHAVVAVAWGGAEEVPGGAG